MLTNVSDQAVKVDLGKLGVDVSKDLLTGNAADGGAYNLGPYEIAWLT